MDAEPAQFAISHVCDAPREMVYQAFTDPEQLSAWWGPAGHSLPREEMDFDVRPGGHQRWIEVSAVDPGLRIQIRFDLTTVVSGQRLEGVLHVTGRLQEGIEPFATRLRIDFHDEPDGRTRLEIHQWLPRDLRAPSAHGWHEAFAKLDAALRARSVEV